MKNFLMKKFALLFALLFSLSASLALALTLDEARTQGLVGERVDGYIGAVSANPNAEVQALITSTNNGRRQVYANTAKSNGITEADAGVLAAEKLRANAKSGEYVQEPSGQWVRKP
jgi:uncharacterized protein YdbL (DUF1318 family)